MTEWEVCSAIITQEFATLPTLSDVCSAIIIQEFTTYGLIHRHIDPGHKWAWHVVRKGI